MLFKDLSVTQSPVRGLTQIRSESTSFPVFALDFFGGLWHLLNFYAPAAGIGLFASSIAKLLWLRELKGVSWLRLWIWSSGCAAVVGTVGLLVLGRAGKRAT